MPKELNSLGFAKSPAETRVVVAMSGGVDSSVVAALLHEEGYDVIGVTLQLYDYGEASNANGMAIKSKSCCSGQDIYDAKQVAQELGFPHYVLNYESKFRESVIEEFADSYLRGETPIPCVRCNQGVKFNDLLKVARDLGADCMATGHYVRREADPNSNIAKMYRSVDHSKDQSYFLFATTQEQLEFLRFPLGKWEKSITRKHAKRLGLLNAKKPDSQDICFVPNGDYAAVVTKIRPKAQLPGDIIHIDGRIVGKHKGIIHYTVGQRRGIGIGGGVSDNNSPLYVVAINAKKNQVIVGSREDLTCSEFHIDQCNWLGDIWQNIDHENGEKQSIKIDVKFRSVMNPVPAKVELHNNGAGKDKAKITLDEPQYGISPGQAAVCYIDDCVIGGGWIKK